MVFVELPPPPVAKLDSAHVIVDPEDVIKHHRAPVDVDVPDLHEEAAGLGQQLASEGTAVSRIASRYE